MPSIKISRQQHPELCRAYQSGLTQRQVARHFGISQERVRQILEENGLNGKSGGIHKRNQLREQRLSADFIKKYGCTKDQFELVKGHYSEKARSPWHAYKAQRRNAKSRGVPWNLLFWSWWLIWEKSGKWDCRGRGTGHYCMCRIGDAGAYEEGNVYIGTITHNSSLGRTLALERGAKTTLVYSMIKKAGGPSKVANEIGVKASYISQLALKNTIPKKWFNDGKLEAIKKLSSVTTPSKVIFEKTNRI